LKELAKYVRREVTAFVKKESGGKARQQPELVGGSGRSVKLVGPLKSGTRLPDPRQLVTQADEAAAHLKGGQYAKAMPLLDKLIKTDPQHAWAYALRAQAQHYLGAGNQALADADKALSLDPNLSHPHCARGLVFGARKQSKQSLVAFTRAIK